MATVEKPELQPRRRRAVAMTVSDEEQSDGDPCGPASDEEAAPVEQRSRRRARVRVASAKAAAAKAAEVAAAAAVTQAKQDAEARRARAGATRKGQGGRTEEGGRTEGAQCSCCE